MTETLAYGYSCESTQQELSNEYQHDIHVLDGFQESLGPFALDKRTLSVGRVKSGRTLSHSFFTET